MFIFMLLFVGFWAFVHIFNRIGQKEALRIRSEVATEKDAVITTLRQQLQEERSKNHVVQARKVVSLRAANQEVRN